MAVTNDNNIVWVDPESLKTSPVFENFLPIYADVYKSVLLDMKEHGFHSHHPIVIWKEQDYVIDGYTRKKVATKLGVEVAVIYLSFSDISEAKLFAYGEQRNRRDFSDSLLMKKFIEDRVLFESFNNTQKSVKKILRVGDSKANQLIQIANCKNDKLRSLVLSGDLSVNAAYNKIEKNKANVPLKYKKIPMTNNANISFSSNIINRENSLSDSHGDLFDKSLNDFISSIDNKTVSKIPSDFNNHNDLLNHLDMLLSSGKNMVELRYVVNSLKHLQ